jgi:hypothetical protein
VVAAQEKYKLRLPPYPGTAQCVKLKSGGSCGAGHSGGSGRAEGSIDPASIRLNYSLAESSGGLLESDVDPDPIKQFDTWFTVGAPPLRRTPPPPPTHAGGRFSDRLKSTLCGCTSRITSLILGCLWTG